MWKITTLDRVPAGERIAFFGPMCSGKTKCADYLIMNYGFVKVSLADKLKAIAYELYGVTGKDGDNRRIVQELGDKLRSFDDDVFTKYTLATIKKQYPFRRVVIDDLRLPREAELLSSNGFLLIQVYCDEDVRAQRVETLYPNVPTARQSHPTETTWGQIRSHSMIRSTDYSDLIALDSLMEGLSNL